MRRKWEKKTKDKKDNTIKEKRRNEERQKDGSKREKTREGEKEGG